MVTLMRLGEAVFVDSGAWIALALCSVVSRYRGASALLRQTSKATCGEQVAERKSSYFMTRAG
jgi:hypothetical protein